MLNLAQLLQIPHVDSALQFDISPDESRIVFSWNKTGTWELWNMSLRVSDSERSNLNHREEIASSQQTLLAMT
jgi:Tol biopolymer transport system component